MSRSRSLTALLLLALTLGLAATGLATTSASAVVEPKIWGVVLDGKGRPVLDVVVTALDQDDVTVATDRSYDDPDGDSAPRPGYFQLFPQSNGTYTVTLKKRGFVAARVSEVRIANGQRVQGLGEIALLRTSRTSGKLVESSVPVGRKGKVKVTVMPGGQKPTGGVVVKKGKKVVGSAVLRAKHKGKVTVVLDKLAKGSHGLKVSYRGSGVHAASASAKLTLKVTNPRNRRPLPNALAYVG